MKLMKSLVTVALLGGTLLAQAPVDKKPATTAKTPTAKAAKTNAQATASKPVATPASKPGTPAKAVPATAVKAVPAKKAATPAVTKTTVAPKNKTEKSNVQATATPISKPASVKEPLPRVSVKARDPFVSPVIRTNGNVGGCDTGKKCLVVDQIVLKGIVKSPSGFIAVVENPARRAYFMRENDPVFNGKVIRITGDTVVFQEEVMDKLGKQSLREVVKKVNAPAV